MLTSYDSLNSSLHLVRPVNAKIDPLFQKLCDLCTLPSIAVQIIQVAEDENANADDLLAVIEQDPNIAMQLMKVVNSSYCAVRGGVGDLKMAIALLGTKNVRNLALTVSVGAIYNRPTTVGDINPAHLWDHSVCVATLSRSIAKRQKIGNPDEAYLIGLLHDLGLIFVNQFLGELIPKVFLLYQTGVDFYEAEKRVLGFDHVQLGAHVAMKSGLPDRHVLAIDYHRQPQACPEECSKLAHAVYVADYLASRYGHNAFESHRQPAPKAHQLSAIGLANADLKSIWSELPETLANVNELANV